MNSRFGKLEDGRVVYAPDSLDAGGAKTLNPTDASYLAAGWLKVVDEPPEPEEGMRVAPSSWKVEDGTLVRVYKQVPARPGADAGGGARRFSKLKVVMALKAANLWILTKTWIEERGLYDLYLAAQDFAEDNQFFVEGKEELQRLSGKTDAEVEAILAQCVAEG